MATQGDNLLRKTQRGLSILAFETTKQSRILKKRMRTAALQKEIKADLRDLGNLVYNAVINEQPGILGEEEVRILVENVRQNKEEVDRLRDAIARLSRARKHFAEGEEEEEVWTEGPVPHAEEPPLVEPEPPEAKPAPAAKPAAARTEKKEAPAAVEDASARKAPRKKEEKEPAPSPGNDTKQAEPKAAPED